KEQRHVLLLLDNAPSHIPNGLELSNVEIQFLPPNTTSRMQPMDAGAVDKFDQGLENFYKFDQLTAMKWCLVAWKEITALTIRNYFKHIGLFKESITNQILEADELSIESELRDFFHQLRVQNAMSIANFLNPIEEDQGQVEELDDDQTIQMVQQPEEGEEEEEEEIPQISRAEKLKAIGPVVSLPDLSKEKDLDFFKRLRRIQHKIRCSTNTQITLDTWLI
ncbi:hypothetical protein K3495_g16122, partial [Podosphaera aphanis]